MELDEAVERGVERSSDRPARATPPAGVRSALSKGRGLLLGTIIAIAVAGGGWLAVAGIGHAPQPHIGISTTSGTGTPFGPAFVAADNQVTDRQWAERGAAFQKWAGQGPVLLDRLSAAQGLDYIGKSITDPALKAQLTQGVQDQKDEMVAIGFYDDCAEDGDVVRVRSGGIDVTVPLFHQVQYVEIPVPKGQQVQVVVSGIRDGTGGITLGMVTPAGDVHMPRLQPGEQVSFVAK